MNSCVRYRTLTPNYRTHLRIQKKIKFLYSFVFMMLMIYGMINAKKEDINE